MIEKSCLNCAVNCSYKSSKWIQQCKDEGYSQWSLDFWEGYEINKDKLNETLTLLKEVNLLTIGVEDRDKLKRVINIVQEIMKEM